MAAKMARKFFASIFAASSREHPWSWALAITVGMAFGLMPKGNLIAAGLGISVCFLRYHRLLAIVAAVVATFSFKFSDPWMDRFGQYMLRSDSLQPLWQEMFQWPILPWLHWNNSIVMGSLVFSFASLPLTYTLNLLFVRRRVSRQIITSIARKTAVRTAESRRAKQEDSRLPPSVVSTSTSVGLVESKPDLDILRADELSLEQNSLRHRSVKRRERGGHRIDVHGDESVVRPNVAVSRPSTEPQMAVAATSEESSALLQETVIEIVRYRPSETSSTKPKVRGPITRRNLKQNSSWNDMSAASQTTLINKVEHQAATKESDTPSHIHLPTTELADDATSAALGGERPREEALRYLLWHLSGVKQTSSSLQERAS
jgi:uncharacterized protein (TIGR03546 family)